MTLILSSGHSLLTNETRSHLRTETVTHSHLCTSETKADIEEQSKKLPQMTPGPSQAAGRDSAGAFRLEGSRAALRSSERAWHMREHQLNSAPNARHRVSLHRNRTLTRVQPQ